MGRFIITASMFNLSMPSFLPVKFLVFYLPSAPSRYCQFLSVFTRDLYAFEAVEFCGRAILFMRSKHTGKVEVTVEIDCNQDIIIQAYQKYN